MHKHFISLQLIQQYIKHTTFNLECENNSCKIRIPFYHMKNPITLTRNKITRKVLYLIIFHRKIVHKINFLPTQKELQNIIRKEGNAS